MVFLLSCSIHHQPQDRVCANYPCCEVLCHQCLISHQLQTDHHLAICLNPHTLNYFTRLTDYIHLTMLKWMHRVTNSSFQAVFTFQQKEGSVWQNLKIKQEISKLALLVLDEYKQLMLANKNFVEINRNSQLLYHPQCIKDIYNLIVYPWQENAQMIIHKLKSQLQQALPQLCRQYLPIIQIQHQHLIQIQNYRNELINPIRQDLIIDLKSSQILSKGDSLGQIDTNGSQNNERSPLQQSNISHFQVAQQTLHIKVIDSYQHIESQQPSPSLELINLHQYSQDLLRQNQMLKIQNANLMEDNAILKGKCEKMQAERRQVPSSGKKRRETELNSELLSEIVQIQCQLSQNRHDIQLLVTYLNELAQKKIISAQELRQRLLPLRTINIH